MKDLLSDNLPNSSRFTPNKLLKLACIADILDFPDYALEIMVCLTLNHGSSPRYNLANAIYDRLSQFPELVEKGLDSLDVIRHLHDHLNN